MVDELRVSPEELRHAGDQIGRYGQALATVQRSCHDEAQAAHGGWVGRSAGALSALLDGWATLGRTQIQRIGDQARALHDAAAEFTFLGQRGAASLTYPPGGAPVR